MSGESRHLPREPARRPEAGLAQLGHLDRAPGEAEADSRHPAQVAERGVDDVDPRVRVVDPVDRDLMDAQPGPFRQHQQFGVEEPALVLDQRQQLPGLVGPDRLEPALRVGELGPQGGSQQQVVAARDDLALGTADHPRSPRQPGADGDVAVPGQQRRDQGEESVQVGGQVHVHVREHLGVRRRPDLVQRPAAAGDVEVDGAYLGVLGFERARGRPGPVGAPVVRDRDAGAEGKGAAQVLDQPRDARLEVVLLVLDRHDDVYI